MTIIQLEYLLAVANHGSFSLAAEHCFVTQPTLSMQIKNLEEELGVVLLDRTKQPVVPTEQGAAVIDNARQAILSFENVREEVRRQRGEVSGTLTVGVIPTVAPCLLHTFVPQFTADYPQVRLEIKEMITADIVREMMRDALDCAIVTAGSCPDSIAEQELFSDRFVAYVSPQHRLFGRPNIRTEEIDPSELLLPARGHCLRDQTLELFAGGRRKSADLFEADSLETLMRMVDCTGGMAIVPEMAAAMLPAERQVQVAQLAKGNLSRKIALAVRRTYVKISLVEALRGAIAAGRL